MLIAPASASDFAHQLSADGAEALADLIHSAVAVASVRELRSPEWDASLSRIEQATAAERASDEEASSDDENVAALARVRRNAAVAQDCR
jgi:hypothetical protein